MIKFTCKDKNLYLTNLYILNCCASQTWDYIKVIGRLKKQYHVLLKANDLCPHLQTKSTLISALLGRPAAESQGFVISSELYIHFHKRIWKKMTYFASNLDGKIIYNFYGNSFLRIVFKSCRKLKYFQTHSSLFHNFFILSTIARK